MIPPSRACAPPTSFLQPWSVPAGPISLKCMLLALSTSALKGCRSAASLGIDRAICPLYLSEGPPEQIAELHMNIWWQQAYTYLFFCQSVQLMPLNAFPLRKVMAVLKRRVMLAAAQNSWSSSTSPSLSPLPPDYWILNGDYDITFAAMANNTSAFRSIQLA